MNGKFQKMEELLQQTIYQVQKKQKIDKMKYKHLILSLSLIMLGPLAHAEEIGSVDTVFKMIGPDHKIVVEAFDDPDVKNVTCYVSRAKTGANAALFNAPATTAFRLHSSSSSRRATGISGRASRRCPGRSPR